MDFDPTGSRNYLEEVEVRHRVLLEPRQVRRRRRYSTAGEVIRGIRVALIVRRLRGCCEEKAITLTNEVQSFRDSKIRHADLGLRIDRHNPVAVILSLMENAPVH